MDKQTTLQKIMFGMREAIVASFAMSDEFYAMPSSVATLNEECRAVMYRAACAFYEMVQDHAEKIEKIGWAGAGFDFWFTCAEDNPNPELNQLAYVLGDELTATLAEKFRQFKSAEIWLDETNNEIFCVIHDPTF